MSITTNQFDIKVYFNFMANKLQFFLVVGKYIFGKGANLKFILFYGNNDCEKNSKVKKVK